MPNRKRGITLLRSVIEMSTHATFTRFKWFVIIMLLTVVEIGPFPLMGLTLLYVIAFRPRWFKALVDQIYS